MKMLSLFQTLGVRKGFRFQIPMKSPRPREPPNALEATENNENKALLQRNPNMAL